MTLRLVVLAVPYPLQIALISVINTFVAPYKLCAHHNCWCHCLECPVPRLWVLLTVNMALHILHYELYLKMAVEFTINSANLLLLILRKIFTEKLVVSKEED